MNPIIIYLIIINILGFVLFFINSLLYKHTAKGQIDALVTIAAIIGGSLGIVISILIFDRKPEKGTMMSRVFVICVLVIQITLFFIIKKRLFVNVRLDFWNYFAEHKILLIYLGIINVIAFVAFAIDKKAAEKDKSRIRIVTLLGLAFIGGSIGSLTGMYLLHHKTKKDYFTVGIPLIMFMQVVVLFFVMNIS